jgi:hypothetical protein
LSAYGFGLKRLVGGGYDGCSVMAESIEGVLKLIRDKYPKALFFHCASHQMNLVVSDLNDLAVVHKTICTEKILYCFIERVHFGGI